MTMSASPEYADAELVSQSRAGSQDAFGRIVARYQRLICSLTYNATGSLSQSEDLAQETFLAAWKQIGDLREPERLRFWLCGIARNLSRNMLRGARREPGHASEPLETARAAPSTELPPSEQAISREEEAILWRALEAIPSTYREPLILFYREDCSVEQVASALELSSDAVKQRLARGRKKLHEEVAAFVEGALRRTSPDKAFTLGVLAALPAFATSASAATAVTAVAKAGAATKMTSFTGISGAVVGPVLGVLGGWLGIRMSLANTRTPRERGFVARLARIALILVVDFAVIAFAFLLLARGLAKIHPAAYIGILGGLAAVCAAALLALAFWGKRRLNAIRLAERQEPGGGDSSELKLHPLQRAFEFRSRQALLGLPLVHVRFGDYYTGEFRMACGWIAIGDCAWGVLFGAGWFATGGIALGFVSVGLLAGGMLVVGLVAEGAVAAGLAAFGGCAAGWLAAAGGIALSHAYAVGGLAFAPHANDAVAREFFSTGLTTAFGQLLNHAYLLAFFLAWPVILTRRQRRDGGRVRETTVPAVQFSGRADVPTSGAGAPDPQASRLGPDFEHTGLPGQSSRRSNRRKHWLMLAVLVPVFALSLWLFIALPHKMKSLPSILAYLVALGSFLGLAFTVIALSLRGGFAPGWQIRCPQCGLTVDASTGGMVRVGSWGTDRRLGWCERCRKHRMLIIEPVPLEAAAASQKRSEPGDPRK